MSKTLFDLMQSEVRPVTISSLDGPRHRGYLISLGFPADATSGQLLSASPTAETVTLQPAGDSTPSHLEWTSIKAIHFVKDLETDTEESVRFFDSAAIPPYLWVRVSFTDGEVIEGKIDNSLSLMNGPYLMLYPLDEAANQECICVPRAAIANLQVITFRR